MSDIKSFLHQFCQKNQKDPVFEVRPTGPKHRQRFLCELRIDGYSYVAAGNSTNKKDAQANASKDFVSYLVRQGLLNKSDVPIDLDAGIPQTSSIEATPEHARPSHSVFGQGMGPENLGEAYRPVNRGGNDNFRPGGQWHYMDRAQEQKRLEEAEELDVNAQIHGNWTIENAKSKLHQFLQSNKINADYKYSQIGQDHNKSFVAEMSFYVKQLGRPIHGRDTASNKQSASKSCALSIVRQLFHLGVIEAYSGTLKKDKSASEMAPFDVKLDPTLRDEIQECLKSLKIKVTFNQSNQPVSLLSEQILDDFLPSKPVVGGVVPWSPPAQNWNPWLGCNIDEGPLASATLEKLSEDLLEDMRMSQNNQNVQESMRNRQQLPVYSMKGVIMEAINEHPVIIIRGNTGEYKYFTLKSISKTKPLNINHCINIIHIWGLWVSHLH